MDKLDLVVDRIDDLKESTDKRLESIDKNLAEHMKQTMLVREQNQKIAQQNKILADHTDILTSLHKDNEKRIEILETPYRAANLLKKTAMWISTVIGAVLIIIKLLGTI